MVRFKGGLLLFSAYHASAAPPRLQPAEIQHVLGHKIKPEPANPRNLTGRFLHITDIHPDPFYKIHSEPGRACHSGSGLTGYYGAEITSCDSPYTLVDATFDWIRDNLKDEIDFVMWTGDSARHDNDEHYPRTVRQVVDSNRNIVQKFVEVFGKSDNIDDPDPTNDFIVPIIPTFGNNDILPHNIFTPGPNRWTKTYADVWKGFVPEEQRHSFARGGWFFTEVIPNKLAVFSLNTMYFFDSNSAVDGCDRKSEPGYEQMEWLRIQLQFLRERGMKAILTGHVPPARTKTKQAWDETCWQKYTLWTRQYRDVIVGSLYGHMNLDHFILQDTKKLNHKFEIEDTEDIGSDKSSTTQFTVSSDEFRVQAKSTYLNELRHLWSKLPNPPKGLSYSSLDVEDEMIGKKKDKKSNKDRRREKFLRKIGGIWAERFSVCFVSPSVIPNFYPTLRVFEYNITELEHHHPAAHLVGQHKKGTAEEHRWADLPVSDALSKLDENADDDDFRQALEDSDQLDVKRRSSARTKKKKKTKKPSFRVPEAPPKRSLPGPAYSAQTFTFLSYTQWFANLSTINNETAAMRENKPSVRQDQEQETQRKRHPHHTKTFKYEIEYDTRNDKTYKMADLTVRKWLDLAHRMGKKSGLHTSQDIIDPFEEAGGKLRTVEASYEKDDEDKSGDDKDEEESMTKHKKKKHKKKKKKGKKVRNKVWKMFVKRAYVMTKPDDEVDDDFGS